MTGQVSNASSRREARRTQLIASSRTLTTLSRTLGALFVAIGVAAFAGGLIISLTASDHVGEFGTTT
jgi:uncharacterized membrane protein